MKKLFLIPSAALSVLGTVSAFAQDAAAATETVVAETQIAGDSMHHVMMQKFLEGGWEWMLPVLLCLVIGLAVAIERILYLSLSTINSKKLIASVEEALKNGGIEAAKEVCRNTLFRSATWSDRFDLLSGSRPLRPGSRRRRESRRFLRFGSDRPDGVGSFVDRPVHRPFAHVGIYGNRRRYDRGVRRHPGCR